MVAGTMPMVHSARKRSLVAWLASLLILTGCPKRFDPRADTVASSPNREADHEYRQAKARLDIGDHKDAAARFTVFLEKYPNDPLAPSAKLQRARALMGMGESKKAESELAPMAQQQDPNDPSGIRARWLLGFATHKTKDYQRSRELLRPFVGQITGDDLVELHAVLADDADKLGDAEDALKEYGLFFDGARPAEKLYIRDRVSELVQKLSSLDAFRIWSSGAKDGVVAAYLGRRLAAERRAAGDETGAKQILDESKSAREHAGMEEATKAGPRESFRAIGLIVPLSGKGRPLGERALRGALLAADLMAEGLPGGLPVELRVRDSGSDPAKAAAAVEELVKEGVAAIVGSPDKVEAQMSAPKAEALGVPFLELAPDDVRRGELTFKMVRPRAAGATALAKMAIKSGAKTVAVLAPDSAYGRQMAQAFTDAARAAGARVVADLRYPETTTTFIDPVKKLAAAQPDAIFVPAPASQLSLIAPQLTFTGLTRMPGVKPTGKLAALYATADGLNDKFLQSTAKHIQGAVLAPVFYPDQNEPKLKAFVERYRRSHAEDPSSLDALAYDAVRATRAALDHVDPSGPLRQSVAVSLSRLAESGLTGELSFTASGDRSGLPPLYLVGGDEINLLK
jgi:branched-chain amino acid transport system substrate-binding protein